MPAARTTPAERPVAPTLGGAERFSPANRRRLSGPGLRTFLAIADLWGLADEERLLVLGLPSRSTYYNWVKAVREHRDITLDVDMLTRISIVLGIHQALGILHGTEREGVAWLRTPHAAPLFGARPPMALVTSGTQDGLMSVRRFLDAARGGLYMPPGDIDRIFRPYTDADIVFT
ncbi:MbcA/ParS/Xre antitoxin family protein [Chthonobacter albigriseus]|uniref:MbcA/ParS/Xre antitoxin family protein n=1 Tax=Chthonobacter albigriseus TaxID=1683161 RepID=UPI003CC80548